MTMTFSTKSEEYRYQEHEEGNCPDKCDFCEEEKRESAEARRREHGPTES